MPLNIKDVPYIREINKLLKIIAISLEFKNSLLLDVSNVAKLLKITIA